MNDAELRSLERICSKDDLSESNVATLTCLGLKAASEVRRLRADRDEARRTSESWRLAHLAWQEWGARMRAIVGGELNGDGPTRDAIERAVGNG